MNIIKYVKLGSFGLIMKLFLTGMNLLVMVFLARNLDAVNYGRYTFIISIFMIATMIGKFGLPNLVIREIPKININKDSIQRSVFICWGFGFIFLSSLIIFTAFSYLKYSSFFDFLNEVQYFHFLLIPSIIIISYVSSVFRSEFFLIRGQIYEFGLLPFILFSLLVLINELDKLDYSKVLTIYTTTCIVVAIAILFDFFKQKDNRSFSFDKSRVNSVWKSSIFSMGFLGMANIVNRHADTILVGVFNTDKDVAVYNVAAQISLLVVFLLQVVNIVIAPQLSKMHHKNEKDKIQNLLHNSSRVMFLTSLTILLSFLFFGRYFLNLVFGESYDATFYPLLILSCGYLVSSGCGSVGLYLNISGFHALVAKLVIFSVLINLMLNLILIPKFGITGAALSTSIAISFWNIYAAIFAKIKLRLNTTFL